MGAEHSAHVDTLTYDLKGNYVAKIYLPYCKQLWARKLDAEMLKVFVGNELYYYQGSESNIHKYKYLGNKGSVPKVIYLYLDIKYMFIDESS